MVVASQLLGQGRRLCSSTSRELAVEMRLRSSLAGLRRFSVADEVESCRPCLHAGQQFGPGRQ